MRCVKKDKDCKNYGRHGICQDNGALTSRMVENAVGLARKHGLLVRRNF